MGGLFKIASLELNPHKNRSPRKVQKEISRHYRFYEKDKLTSPFPAFPQTKNWI